jgi:hypothetical protein
MRRLCVSADAKIPIVPVEFFPPLDVVNRNALGMEEVPRLVKGERRARVERTTTARDEHTGDQRTDWLGPQDDSQGANEITPGRSVVHLRFIARQEHSTS